MKTCPYCGEKIQDVAKKCRYCGEWIEKKEDIKNKEKVNKEKIEKKNDKKNEEKNTIKNSVKNEGKDENYLQKKADEFEFWYTLGTLKKTLSVFIVSVIIICLICKLTNKWIEVYRACLIAAVVTVLICYSDYLPKTRKKAIEEHIERVKQPLKPEDKKDYSIIAKIFLWVILGFFGLLALVIVIGFLRN